MIRRVCRGCKELIQEKDQEEIPASPQTQQQLTDLIKELSRTLADLNKERQATLKDSFTTSCPIPAAPAGVSQENESRRDFGEKSSAGRRYGSKLVTGTSA